MVCINFRLCMNNMLWSVECEYGYRAFFEATNVVNRLGEKNRLFQSNPESLFISRAVCYQSCVAESEGAMDCHLTSETFWLPIFLLMPREPTLAESHDRQPIKEYNDLSTPLCLSICPPSSTPQSQHFFLSLCTLINFQTNLFIVHHCLSTEVAGTIDLYSPHTTDFALTLKVARNYSSAVFLHFTFAHRREAQSLPSLFISSSTSLSVILHFNPFWPFSKGLTIQRRELAWPPS